jgi:DNA-damage-inducible protein J
MRKPAVVPARIAPDTKAATEKILATLGLTPTEAIRLFYRQIAMRREFPLELKVPNATTARTLAKAERCEELEHFESPDELFATWEE